MQYKAQRQAQNKRTVEDAGPYRYGLASVTQ